MTRPERIRTVAPPGRLVRAAKLRMLLNVTGPEFRRLKKNGHVPPPLPGTRLYDWEAVKHSLDHLAGLDSKIAATENRLIGRARNGEARRDG